MKNRSGWVLLLVIIAVVAFISCSGKGSPVSPDSFNPQTVSSGPVDNPHHLWGYYLFNIDPKAGKVESIPVREIATHLNILQFLEKGPCTDCIAITKFAPSPDGAKLMDVRIKHPFPSKNLTGFDVRGILMFRGSFLFPTTGKTVSDTSKGDGFLANADGYTSLYNYTTVGSGSGGLQGYQKGKFASSSVPDALVNGYKRFVSPGSENTRNIFSAGGQITVTYKVFMPTTGFVLGYAVDSSWEPPLVKTVTDPITQFPASANCPEPWKVEVSEHPDGLGLNEKGGSTTLDIDVYDWQGRSSYSDPLIECPGLFPGMLTASWSEILDGGDRWQIALTNALNAPVGDYKCLVKVEDHANGSSPDYLDLTAYQLVTLTVSKSLPPIAKASLDPIVVAPDQPVNFKNAGSYDPDGGTITKYEWDWENDGTWDEEGTDVNHSFSTEGIHQIQFRVTDDEGQTGTLKKPLEVQVGPETGWARTWGGADVDRANAVALDSQGSTYSVGAFYRTADFNPETAVENHAAKGADDAYLTKITRIGQFQWAITWGGTGYDEANGVAVDADGNIYVTGNFENTVDFDLSPGTNNRTSNGQGDAFLMKVDPDGNVLWVQTWGGTNWDTGLCICLDGNGSVYVGGQFMMKVDFDPSNGDDSHTAAGFPDAFLSKFTTDGTFQWARTWGGTDDDHVNAVTVDDLGNPYVAGDFNDTVDFDPGDGDYSIASNGTGDAFISSFDSSGNFIWAKTWGGAGQDAARGVVFTDATGSPQLFVAGFFSETVDFDTNAGVDSRDSAGLTDAYLSEYDTSGVWDWTETWGGTYIDYSAAVAVDPSGDPFVAGYYGSTIDFDPGAGTDEHAMNGLVDAFVSKFDSSGSFLWARTWGGSGNDSSRDLAVDSHGNSYTVGYFDDTVNFDPIGTENHASKGADDSFILKLLPDGNW